MSVRLRGILCLLILLSAALWTNAGEIHEAIFAEDVDKVTQLLRTRPTLVSAKDEMGLLPLHDAAMIGNSEIITLLLAHKADPNATGQEGETPLLCSLMNQQWTAAELLLSKGANVNAPDKIGNTPLLTVLAMMGDEGAEKVFTKLIAQKVDVNLAHKDNGRTPLHAAAVCGKAAPVKSLLEKGAKPDIADKQGETPLSLAVNVGITTDDPAPFVEAITLLLAKNVDINHPNKLKQRPLHAAVVGKHLEFVDQLLARGADVNAPGAHGNTPLFDALHTPLFPDVLSRLLAKGAHVNAKNDFGKTPLHEAVAMENVTAVTALLAQKADIHALAKSDNLTGSPLHVAARSGNVEIMTLLLAVPKAQVDLDDGIPQCHMTPLMNAVQARQVAMVKLLLQKKANPNAISHLIGRDVSVMDYATMGKPDQEIIRLLKQYGAK